MANTAAPYGLIPAFGMDSVSTELPIFSIAYGAADIATAMAVGSILNVGASAPTMVTATPTTTRNGNTPWGIVMGFEYTTAPAGAPFGTSKYLPANAISAGYGGITIKYTPAHNLFMQIQATANTGASTAIGKNAAISYTAPDAVRQVSKIALDASTINTTNTLGLKIVGFAKGSSGDTYPDYIVTWNQNVHALDNILGV